MKNILNKRLETISAFIEKKDSVIDIGCDHGLLGIYLVLNKKVSKMVSSDINCGPLAKAKENIHKYHVEDKIELRLGDGLKTLSNDLDTIVISGIGGLTIIEILNYLDNYPFIKKIILSPNSDFPLVRKHLRKKGFYINHEEMVLEKGKYYLISEYYRGLKRVDSFFGKLNLDNDVVISYYQNIYNKNRNILKKLSCVQKIKKGSLLKEMLLIRRKISFK